MPGRDRNLSRKAPMADDLLLRWQGADEYQPNFRNPVAEPPRPNRDPNYEDQTSPLLRGIGLGPLQQQEQAPQDGGDVDDLLPEEKETFESVLSQVPEQDLDAFFERLNKYRRIRAMQQQAQANNPQQI